MNENAILKIITNSNSSDYPSLMKEMVALAPSINLAAMPVVNSLFSKIDLAVHKLAGILLLSMKIPYVAPDNMDRVSLYLTQAASLFEVCLFEHVHEAMQELVEVADLFTKLSIDHNRAMSAILPLRSLSQKCMPLDKTLVTPFQAMTFRVCLASLNYNAALPILDREVFEIDPPKTYLRSEDYLSYFYYGALINIGLKRYVKARDCLLNCITAPARSVSAIVVAAYKKYVLVSLIVQGEVAPLPNYTSSCVTSAVRESFPAYKLLADKFKELDPVAFASGVTKNTTELTADENMGIVKQVSKVLVKRKIHLLTQAYTILSLNDIATAAGLATATEAEGYIVSMIDESQIFATINDVEKVVTFKSNPEESDVRRMMSRLNGDIKAAMELAQYLKEADLDVLRSKEFMVKEMIPKGDRDMKGGRAGFPGKISAGEAWSVGYDESMF